MCVILFYSEANATDALSLLLRCNFFNSYSRDSSTHWNYSFVGEGRREPRGENETFESQPIYNLRDQKELRTRETLKLLFGNRSLSHSLPGELILDIRNVLMYYSLSQEMYNFIMCEGIIKLMVVVDIKIASQCSDHQRRSLDQENAYPLKLSCSSLNPRRDSL